MAEKIEVGIVIKGTDKVATDLTKVDKASKELGGNLDMATGALDKMSGGAVGAFKGIGKGIKTGIMGLKSFKVALASTGIGLLVVAVGSLVAYFTKTQKGAELLEIATAAIGVVFSKITDLASTLGEKIFGVFTNPKEAVTSLWGTIKSYFIDKFHAVIESVGLLGSAFKKLFAGDFSGALSDATKGATGLVMELTPMGVAIETVMYVAEKGGPIIKDLASDISEAANAAGDLATRAIQLRKDQRDLSKTFAEGRAQIKEYNLVAEDTTRTLEDRLEAAQKAIDIEKELMNERQRLAQEAVDIQKGEMALSKNTEADKQKLVELEVALINIRTESAEMQTTLGNKLNTINAQAAAVKAAQMQTFLDGLKAMGKAEEEANTKRLKGLKVIADAEKAAALAVRTARLGIVASGFEALKSMAKTEAGQKKLAIAQILVNQGIAMSQAIRTAVAAAASMPQPAGMFAVPGFIAGMIGMVLSTFGQIKGIMNQAGAAGSEVGMGGGGGGGGVGGGMQLGLTPDIEGVTQQLAQAPVKAYVVQSQLADENAMAAEIATRATL